MIALLSACGTPAEPILDPDPPAIAVLPETETLHTAEGPAPFQITWATDLSGSDRIPTEWLERAHTGPRLIQGQVTLNPLWRTEAPILKERVVLVLFVTGDDERTRDHIALAQGLAAAHPDTLTAVVLATPRGARRTENALKASGPFLPWGLDRDEEHARAWDVDSTPDAFLIDHTGRLVAADLREDAIEKIVRRFIRKVRNLPSSRRTPGTPSPRE